MARGYLAGAAVGAVAATVAAGALSVLIGMPEAPEPVSGDAVAERSTPEAEVPEADEDVTPVAEHQDADPEPEGAETPAPVEREVPPARRPGDESRPTVAETAPLALPEEATESAAGGDTAPAALPEATQSSAELDAPNAPDRGGRVSVTTDAPVMAPPSVDGPEAPSAEDELRISTDPAQPPAPVVPADESGLVADAGAASDGDSPQAQTEIAEAPTPEETESDAAGPAPASTDTAPRVAEAQSRPGTGEVADTLPAAQEDPALPDVQAGANEESGPQIGNPAGTIIGRSSSVPVRRIGEDAETGAASQSQTLPDEGAEDAAPVARFAAPDVEVGDRPRMSVVLIDDGVGPLGPETLDAFPFPVSFAIDPAAPDAAERMRGYRDRGFEVLALSETAPDADARDVEVALEASLTELPEVVGVLEAPGGAGLQSSRDVTDQVTEALVASGHGLVMLPNGLNTAQQLAAKAGVPSATVFRDFDGDGQTPDTQRRFLDQAAFRARQEGAVIMLGRLRADTISALLLWSLQDRASQVALVPVSQILRDEG